MFKKKKEEYEYFKAFEEISLLVIQSAELLSSILKDYQLETLESKLAEMHEIEHTADEKKHHMMRYLYQDFLPPIERDDIIELAHALDTTLDMVEDVLIRMDMYQIEKVQPEMLEFMGLVEQAAHKLHEIMKNLRNFKKSNLSLKATVEMNNIEEQGDVLYHRAIKKLHMGKGDLLEIFAYSKIYDTFEKSCDAFEEVADIVEAVILKNS